MADGVVRSAVVANIPNLPETESATLHTRLNGLLQQLLDNDVSLNAFTTNGLGATTARTRAGAVTASAFPTAVTIAGLSTVSAIVGNCSNSNTVAGAAIGAFAAFSVGTSNVVSVYALATNGSSATNSPVVYYQAFGA